MSGLFICTRCDAADFAVELDSIEQVFRGETFKVSTPISRCTMCGAIALTPKQADELRNRTSDAYRSAKDLMTGADIRGVRRGVNMSQEKFAKHIGVGIASLKRWETWGVQNKSSDNLMRNYAAKLTEGK